MKLSVLLATCLAVMYSAGFGKFRSLAVAQTAPDLKTSVDFMSQMVETDRRSMSIDNQCEVFVVFTGRLVSIAFMASQNHFEVFADPDPEDGEMPGYVRFNLGDIDPNSINSFAFGFSHEYVERFNKIQPDCKGQRAEADQRCEHERLFWFDPKLSDMTAVGFRTTDLKPVIERGELKKLGDNCQDKEKLGGACPLFTFGHTLGDHYPKRSLAKTGFMFNDKDKADRFVTAFVHAVRLCGGKEDTFAPSREREH